MLAFLRRRFSSELWLTWLRAVFFLSKCLWTFGADCQRCAGCKAAKRGRSNKNEKAVQSHEIGKQFQGTTRSHKELATFSFDAARISSALGNRVKCHYVQPVFH